MSGSKEIRTYVRSECAVFRKTAEAFGGLSNMAPGFPVKVNGVRILTVEALYQACRFPHRPEVQRKIIEQTSPMTAKMVGKPFRNDSRPDWDRVRVKIMRWVLRVKLAMHWSKFSELLASTGDRPIVEDSRKDDFWGAIPTDSRTLVGMNVLGRLLMELREEIKQGAELRRVEPPAILDFLLFGAQLGAVDFRADKSTEYVVGVANTGYAVHESPMPLFADLPFESPVGHRSTDAAHGVTQMNRGMIEGLKPYAEYKESGQEWLGKVPAHWDVRRTKLLLREVDSRSTTGKEQLLRVSQYTGVTQRKSADGSDAPDTRAASLVGYKRVLVNDLVINIMLAWNGSMGTSRFDGIASPAYCVYRFNKDAQPWYFHQLFRLPLYKGRIKTASTGVVESRLRLYSDDLGRIEAILPPPDEQAAIVRFLDHANRKIDGFIRAKRKLIGLLIEQKQAIIHRAVTRGLDPDVPLKPSGIPWLGDIPMHWEVRRLRFCIVGKLAYGANAAAEFDNPDWPRYLRITDFNSDGSLRADTFRSLPPHVAKDYPVEDGDILFARSGATVGKAFLVRTETEKACYAGYLIRARPNADVVLPTFLFAFTQSAAFVCWKDAIFNRATIQNIGADKYANLVVPIPPIPEQQAILDFTEKDIAPLRTAIARTEREIALMQEYRTRLTADIVTGKLDVREAATKLPDLPVDVATTPVADEMTEEIEMEEAP